MLYGGASGILSSCFLDWGVGGESSQPLGGTWRKNRSHMAPGPATSEWRSALNSELDSHNVNGSPRGSLPYSCSSSKTSERSVWFSVAAVPMVRKCLPRARTTSAVKLTTASTRDNAHKETCKSAGISESSNPLKEQSEIE